MIALIKNNIKRLKEKRGVFLLLSIVSVIALFGALFLSQKEVSLGRIALLETDFKEYLEMDHVDIIRVSKPVKMSELMSGSYDAYVSYDDKGVLVFESVVSENKLQQIKNVFENRNQEEVPIEARGRASTILGFVLMFVLMQANVLMMLFGEDKERKLLERIFASPLSVDSYLLGQVLFAFILLFFPLFIGLVSVELVTGMDLGISLGAYAVFISVLCFLGSTFSLMLYTFSKNSDDANMKGSAIIILTSILSGSFGSFLQGDAILSKISIFFPQSIYLKSIAHYEKGGAYWAPLFCVIILSIGFAIIAKIKLSKDIQE